MWLRTKEAAGRIGVSKNTLLRWFKEKKVSEVPRDRNGWRIFRLEDIIRIKEYADRKILPEEFGDVRKKSA